MARIGWRPRDRGAEPVRRGRLAARVGLAGVMVFWCAFVSAEAARAAALRDVSLLDFGVPGPEQAASPESLCDAAIHQAEQHYRLPPGLLHAMSEVESGRFAAGSHHLRPWPWTVQSQAQSLYFASRDEAVRWVVTAQRNGVSSIDTGCLQVNLHYHPTAFQSVDDAFDPVNNAAYAARFLVSLHATVGDWRKAAGLYHSQTPALAIPYQQRVMRALGGGDPLSAEDAPPSPIAMLQAAWNATLRGPPQPETRNGSPSADTAAQDDP